MTRRISSCTGNTRGASSFKRTSVALLLSCLTVTMATSFSGLAAAAPWEQGKIAIELLTNGVDADTPDGPSFPVGTPVVWEYLISNPGSQTLYNLVIYNQDTRSVFNLPKRICKVASLQPGDTTTCRKTGTVEEGSFQNRGRVVAYGKKPWRFWNWSLDEDYSHYQGRLGIPSVALESLINGEDADEPKGAEYYEGSSITKKYKIHNTGELNLTDLVITENQLAPSVASREVCKISSLAVGEKQECKLLEIAGLGEFKLESIVRATSIHGQIVEAIDLSHFQGKAKFSASPEATPSIGNAPLKVVFKPTVVTDSAIERYEWDFDSNGTWDRSETVGRNQQWTYSTPGKYVAKLRITDSKGQQTIGNVEVTVNNKPPVVSAEANPSNGAIPLTVNFNTTASDSDGISQYEWDFDGDGNFEQTSISGTIQFTYTSIGIYKPAVKVTDNQGFSTTLQVPTIEVQALGEGAPTVTATATTVAGNAPLSVGLSASLGNVSGAVSLWQWDFDGDGNFDFESTKSPSVNHIYTAVGSHYPMVRLTTDNGFTVEDRIKIAVTPKVSLSRSLDTIDPGLSETSTINTSLGGDTRIQLQIETSGGDVVKTLVPWEDRTAGKYTDSWDGTNDQGNTVPEGDYRAILLYELDDAVNRYDLSLTTGGGQYNPPRSRIPSNFAPYAGKPLEITFTLSRASEVTSFMGRFNVNTRLMTFHQREPLGKGTHRIVWHGENENGKMITLPPGESFLFGIWGYYLPDNSIYVRSGSHVSAVKATPAIFSVGGVSSDGEASASNVSFNLTQPGSAELGIYDLETGKEVASFLHENLTGGANTIKWDGRDNDGNYLASGYYRLGVTGVAPNGHRSITVYTLQRVYN